MRAIKTTISMSKFLVQAMMKAVMAIIRLIYGLFGGGLARPSKTGLATTTDDVADTYRDSYRQEMTNDHAMTPDYGQAVHQYAKANDPAIRSAVDLGSLDMDQMGWLLGLSDSNLMKLAAAGPKACELAVTGRRCGVVGLPLPQPSVAAVTDKSAAVRALLMDRIRQERRVQLTA